MALEREPDERAFDGDEVESRVRHDERHGGIACGLGASDCNRCMLVAGPRRMHDGWRRKDGAGDAEAVQRQICAGFRRFVASMAEAFGVCFQAGSSPVSENRQQGESRE